MTKTPTAKRCLSSCQDPAQTSSAGGVLAAPFGKALGAAKVEQINERELTSINALLAYVSYNQNVQQETVKTVMEATFGVDKVDHLRRDDYMRAIEFLVDLKMGEVIN